MVAGRQFGVVARWQLLQAGITPQQIKLRRRNGRLHGIHCGVYLVGHASLARYAPEMAALLACGEGGEVIVRAGGLTLRRSAPRSVLSHRTAATLWNLTPYPAPGDVCITIPYGRNPNRSGIDVRRGNLARQDLRWRHGMPLTSPPRTLLDLAADLGRGPTSLDASPHRLDAFEHLVAEAQYRRVASEAELRDQIARNPGKAGVGRLREVLDLPGGPRRTRSPGERAMLRLVRARGIEGYETNYEVAGYEVDFYWPEARLAVEVDGYDAHSSRTAFERDRIKIAALQASGIEVMPVTGRSVRRDPDGVVRRLRAAIAQRS